MSAPTPPFLPEGHLERLRKMGIDAHWAGAPRAANPFAYEASQAWDSGWLQAQQAQQEEEASAQPPAQGAPSVAFGHLLDIRRHLGLATEMASNLPSEEVGRMDWGDAGSLAEGARMAQELGDWLERWRWAFSPPPSPAPMDPPR